MIDNKYDEYNSDMFEFIQKDEKLYDKKFETKPIGYFKDALIRFRKNKGNVVATLILFAIILGTVLIPLISTKNYEQLEEQLSHLPPRMPILEKFGIFDGTSKKTAQPVDLSTIDPETGLGLPIGYIEDYIVMDTLVNYVDGCTDKSDLCTGGEAVLRLDYQSDMVAVISGEYFTLNPADNPVLTVDVFSIGEDSTTALNVYMKPSFGGEYELIKTITAAGVYDILPLDELGVAIQVISKLKLELVSNDYSEVLILNSISLSDDSQTEPVIYDAGYDLSMYTIDNAGGAGVYVRQNGELLLAEFSFKNYVKAFGDKTEIGFSAEEYNEIILEHGADCATTPDPENPDGWLFGDACPFVKVIKQNEAVNVGGIDYFSYELVLNYAQYKGYDEIPYYLFGTTSAGRDLFTLMWVATRTSLLIGVIVATINITVGIIYGAISGYYGGTVDIMMQRFSEVIGRVPWLVTLSIFIALFGPGLRTLIFILIFSGWIGVAYVTRTQFYRFKGREYVLASRTLGAKDSRLIFRHILPNGIGTIITSSILTVPYVIFAESTISYLGFGIGHGQSFNILGLTFSGVSIGVLLADGRTELLGKPYLTLWPALLISILMITFNMFGNALRDAFNPALRGSE